MTRRGWTRALWLLLAVRLALGLAYSALTPPGEAPDEADHYAYAASIGREARLPSDPAMTQAKHPPLYHILAGLAGRVGGLDTAFLRSNPDVSVVPGGPAANFFIHTAQEAWPWRGGALSLHLGRLVSVLAGVALVAVTWGIGRALWPARPHAAFMAAAFVAFLPEALFIGGAQSNDMLAAFLSGLALFASLHATTARGAAATGLALGLAFLTKASCVAVWPVAVLVILSESGARWAWDARARRGLGLAALTGGVALAVAAPWLWRNWSLYRDPLGTPLVLATIDVRTTPLNFAWLFKGWFLSFWGKFGGAGHIALPWPFYAFWGGLLVTTAGGFLVQRNAAADSGAASCTTRGLVLVVAPLLTAAAMISYSRIALGTDQGRLLFPALAPLGLLIAGGGAGWLSRRDDGVAARGAGLWAAGLALVGGLALYFGIARPFAAPPAPPAAEVAAATPVAATFGDALELIAADWPTAGGELTLYWRAARPLAEDVRVTVRLLRDDGSAAWEWRRSPGAGRFSTDRWPVGRIVADAYRVPGDALAAAARLEIGAAVFNGPGLLPPALLLEAPR